MFRESIMDDFDAINRIRIQNNKYLGNFIPLKAIIRERPESIIVYSDNDEVKGFCLFGINRRKNHLTVNEIAFDISYQRKGLGTLLINYLKDRYKKNILAKCIKDSDSEKFWSKKGKLLKYDKSKRCEVGIYFIDFEERRKLF